jgi:two-component system, cell cycle sensor histidine kinase and response regulator CckA
MKARLRILHLEDSRRDAELIRCTLEEEGLDCDVLHVKNKDEFEAAITNDIFHVVLSDFALPHYNGLAALDLVRTKIPTLPFILLSGTVGEEVAVQSLKTGATDYILKQNPARLVSAIRRALEEGEERVKRQQAEMALRESEERFQFAARATNDVIWDWNLDTNEVWRNEAFTKLFGYRAEEIEPGIESWISRLHPEDKKRVLSRLHALGESGGDVWSDQYRFRRGDGTYAHIFDRGYVIHNAAGKPVRMICAMMDTTEKMKLEAQFLRAQRMESIGALSGGVAHDLNNILAPILMVADLLQDELVTEENRKMLEIVKTSAERGSEMVKQILSFARGVSGDHAVLQVKPLICDMVKLLQGTFPRSIQIRMKFGNDIHPVKGDATQLHQVLMNLCVNARDAMPNGGSLLIEAAIVTLEEKYTPMQPEPLSGPYVLLTVTDTGEGIPSHLLDKIYEPFFTTKGIGKGTGLGLSTVLGIVKTHNGFVEVSSHTGKGTTFRVYLPASMTPETTSSGDKPSAPPMGHGERVLVVDDEFAILEITRETLGLFNYQVFTAQNGAEAVTVYHQHHREIKAVITDMMMPIMDGTATIKALQEIDPQVRIICVSGLSSNPNLTAAARLNVQASLKKPFTPEKLLTTLRRVIEDETLTTN